MLPESRESFEGQNIYLANVIKLSPSIDPRVQEELIIQNAEKQLGTHKVKRSANALESIFFVKFTI